MNAGNPGSESQSKSPHSRSLGVAGRVAQAFIHSKLTPLIIVTSILLGLGAVRLLPREEEPQIKVPMIDVMVSMPGFSAKEVEQRATRPMEKLLWEISGVDHIYSISRPEESLVIVRFDVGEDIERSLVKLNQKLQSNFDKIPPGVSYPLIKPRSIDDVPILALTFHSVELDHLQLRRLAAQAEESIKQISQVAETSIIGGARRQVRVLLDPIRLSARNLTVNDVAARLRLSNVQSAAGPLTTDNREVKVETKAFFQDSKDVGSLVVGVYDQRPVFLHEVAEIRDGAEEVRQYVFFGRGDHAHKDRSQTTPSFGDSPSFRGGVHPAVTLTIAKRPGSNAISVADEALRKLEQLKEWMIPGSVEVEITRHYGETAAEKSNELLFHMGIAVVGVSLLILLTLGFRESGIVALAIPTTLALTLLVFYLAGYTLNRITLFALIFSIGILVDDAIVVVENIVRHFQLPRNRDRNRFVIAAEAVGEVGNPTILATFAVIAAVLPMAFVGGLMGPYMRPIPVGASAAMMFSLAIAFIVTPWAAVRMLRKQSPRSPAGDTAHTRKSEEDLFTRVYRHIMGPLIRSPLWRWLFLLGILVLLLGSMALVGIGWVGVKMLPFDNKSEFQVILNMPEGSSLEETAGVALEIGEAIRREPEVTDYQVYAGTAAPFNFNGLVRHYFLRSGAHVADLQINLVAKHHRDTQSHEIAKRVRPRVAEIAALHDARIAVAEVPPGPPVLQTLVAEIYGPTEASRHAMARRVREIFQQTEGVVDVDSYMEADQVKKVFVVDKQKAALHGIDATGISRTLKTAVSGTRAGILHAPNEREDVEVLLELPRSFKSYPEALLDLQLHGFSEATERMGLVPLRELGSIKTSLVEKSIHHKNLMPVTYVIGDVAGGMESPVYAILEMNRSLKELDGRHYGGTQEEVPIFNASMPFTDTQPSIKWNGEWQITIEVFRDLGLAFVVVLVLIYVLMVGWFRSFLTPCIVMAAIPFSLVGILPAHGAMNAFFTATSMIGFMAGAGIVVRNSIILVDFIEQRLSEGMPLAEAVVDAGAVRFRPMLLTAMAVVVGASVILFDPIFQGLAIALMAGEIASLLISRMAVPVLYYLGYR